MKHRMGFNKLSKNVSHRHALYRSMATALFKYERIKTTKPKAKEIRRVAEKMISRARMDSVHNRRIIGKRIRDKAVLAKLFTDIGPRFKSRPGGYTRILKLGPRYGDASEMVLLELVERAEPAPRRRKKEAAKAESGPVTEGAGAADTSAGKTAKAKRASAAKSGASAGSSKGASGSARSSGATAKTRAKTAAKPSAKAVGAADAGNAADAADTAGEKPRPARKSKPAADSTQLPAEEAQPAESPGPQGGAQQVGGGEES